MCSIAMTYRNRDLLDYAREAPCALRLGPCSEQVGPCHSDQLEDGRGEGHKSSDALCIPGCAACHALFTREHLGRQGYFEVHARALKRYIVWLFSTGRINVKRKGATAAAPADKVAERKAAPATNGKRVFENMTKVFITIGKDVLVVRVWSKAKERSFVGRSEVLALQNKVPFENVDRLADAIEAVPNVSAYEIVATNGMGGVVYMEWP